MGTEKVVIIGSGPAGWSAAIYAARAESQPAGVRGGDHRREPHRGHAAAGTVEPDDRSGELRGLSGRHLTAYLDSAIEQPVRRDHGPAFGTRRQRPGADGADAAAGQELRHADHHRRHREGRFPVASVCADALGGEQTKTETGDRGHRRPGELPGPAVGRTRSRTAASARARCATVRCRGFATSRWWWSAAAIRPSKKRPT